MTKEEMLLRIAKCVLADYSDDAKVRDVIGILADNGYAPVDAYRRKCAEVEARMAGNAEEVADE